LLIFLVFCVVFLVRSVLLIFLVFCVVFLVRSVLLIFLVFCVVVFGEIRVAHVSSFLCYVFYFVCLRLVSCVPNVAVISVYIGNYISSLYYWGPSWS
jgi:hypothetical protein